MLNYYKNIKSPKVLGEIELEEFLDRVQNPNSNIMNTILRAREIYQSKGKEQYNIIKTTELPCYTLNFCYNSYKVDKNIKAPTGYIYIDLDDDTNLDTTNQYVCASWRSLSNTGRGILVKVDNLSLNNFKMTYTAISEVLNIHSDTEAGKASQFNTQSYDPNPYYNENSIVWDTNTTNDGINKNTPITYTYKNREKKDESEMGVKLRYDNLGDIEFNNQPFLIFENEKLPYASFYIPKRIYRGSRNNKISLLAYQSYALNPFQSEESFRAFIYSINRSRCDIPLSDKEVEIIIQKTINKKDIQPILNKERRIAFNPKSNLSKKVKYKVIGSVVGEIKRKNSIKKIEEGINEWNPKIDGKISQLELAKKLGMSKNTINEYYRLFKDKTNRLKIAYKALKENK